MSFIVDLFTSGGIGTILGGITGLLGNWVKSRHEEKMFALREKAKADDREHDLAVIRLEGETAVAVADIQRQEADDVASANALTAAYKMEPKRFLEGDKYMDTFLGRWLRMPLFGVLDVIRGSMRPVGTAYMAVVVTMIYWEFQAMMETMNIQMTPDQVFKVYMYLVGTFAYLMITSFVFWYGDRNRQSPPKALR